ncbi:hypothetical protein AF332_02800 [Sporosarcina globispora]|uniref:Uncharacterized protein n=1 Tax=Sporosarcina globispora TaxID=1459 RepID=A0A0M0G7T0_SPOGL|nr:hypothetical protein AF332_02800 [Sporosarcina globispora]
MSFSSKTDLLAEIRIFEYYFEQNNGNIFSFYFADKNEKNILHVVRYGDIFIFVAARQRLTKKDFKKSY